VVFCVNVGVAFLLGGSETGMERGEKRRWAKYVVLEPKRCWFVQLFMIETNYPTFNMYFHSAHVAYLTGPLCSCLPIN
jgi:hypothetical protein